MKRFLKIAGFSFLGLFILLLIAGRVFWYKAQHGFDRFETEAPAFEAEESDRVVMLFSKTNAFRHGEAIEAMKALMPDLASANDWTLWITDNGAAFNPAQLSKVDVVVWSNVTGRVLNDEQRSAFKDWLLQGGGFVGIHGAGDFSHRWDWYFNSVLRAHFSHHNLSLEPAPSSLHLEVDTLNPGLSAGLAPTLSHADEWYVFTENPRSQGSSILYTVDGSQFDPNGNIRFLVSGKDFGMGDDHPVAWSHPLQQGRVFYTSLGHHGAVFNNPDLQKMLVNAIEWAAAWP